MYIRIVRARPVNYLSNLHPTITRVSTFVSMKYFQSSKKVVVELIINYE